MYTKIHYQDDRSKMISVSNFEDVLNWLSTENSSLALLIFEMLVVVDVKKCQSSGRYRAWI